MNLTVKTMIAAALAAFTMGTTPAAAQPLPVFKTAAITNADPSLWAITLIKQRKIDEKYGFDLQYTLKPVSVAYTDFISGADPVCLCLTIATGARFLLEGVDVALAWTYNSYRDSYLVTENQEIRSPSDLAGHTLAGSTGSGSWVFQQYFLSRHQGVDLAKVKVPSIVASAQSTHLLAGRIDAITTFADGRTKLEAVAPGRFRYIPIFDRQKWQAEAGIDHLPMFLFGLRRSWYEQPGHPELLRKFHAAYRDAIGFMIENPQQAAELLGEKNAQAPVAFVVETLTKFPESASPNLTKDYRGAVQRITQDILPPTGLISRALTEAEVDRFILDFEPR